jgi:NADH-quinone oxidoreductase subunit L
MAAWLVALTIGLPWAGAAGVLLARDRRPRAQHLMAVAVSLAAGAAALALIAYASPQVVIRIPAGGVFGDFTFTPDGFGVVFAAIATTVGSVAVVFSVADMRGEAQLGRYYALMLLFIGAMAGLVLTSSLLLLFLFWEMVAFCSYALISFHNDDPKAVAGGIKALIITQAGGIGLLLGVVIVYATLGTYDIWTFLRRTDQLSAGTLAIVAFGFLAAAAAKSAQVPFHTWLPDAMEAPTPVTALIHAATMVNAGPYLLARFYPAFAPVPGWTGTVVAVGVLSAVLAGMMALASDDLKRMLAYSTISQLGVLVYGIGIGAIFATQFHLLSHAVFKALLFLGAGAVIHVTHTRDMRLIGGLGRSMPFVRNTFIVGALALAGVPIFNGFWSKELLLGAGLAAGRSSFVVMLGVAALTAAYATRAVATVFWGRPGPTAVPAASGAGDVPQAMRAALGALGAATMFTWLLAGPLAGLFRRTLPAYPVTAVATLDVVIEVLTTPATLVALGAVAAGAAAWGARARLGRTRPPLSRAVTALARACAADFGFAAINALIVRAVGRGADAARATQTGQLSWNLAAVVIALVLVLALLAMRA